MAAGATYEPIATASPTNGTIYTFSGFPSSYTDLVLVGSCIMTGGTTLRLRLNGSTSGHLYQISRSDGTVAGSGNTSMIELCDNNGSFLSTFVVNIMDYSATTLQKVVLGQSGDQANSLLICGGLATTSAITSISVLTTNGQSFASGTKLTLYGIARA